MQSGYKMWKLATHRQHLSAGVVGQPRACLFPPPSYTLCLSLSPFSTVCVRSFKVSIFPHSIPHPSLHLFFPSAYSTSLPVSLHTRPSYLRSLDFVSPSLHL
ncbi:hypothetical protein CHARACLAT_028424 [Characodon lateralis]|uniref:Uncharacterized protein n=1 Tax=Characodon lateralis TaxID=208331 RepID=A0ABU7DWI7_9TELE|nr:hypothetical protein [Characodon lateralis]